MTVKRAAGRDGSGRRMDSSDSGLPPSLEAAWGLRPRPGKGPKPGLSLDRIVAAGIEVASRDGLAAVSMSRVAAELGAAPMSLYRYVNSKGELLNLMVDTALGPPPEADPAGGWRAGLAAWAWAQLQAMRRHLWAVRIPLSGPPATPNSVAWIEQGLRCLRATGLAGDAKMSVILLLSGFVRNHVTMEADIDAAVASSGLTGEQAMAGYSQMLARLIGPRDFPELGKVLAAGVLASADPWDEEVSFGLDRILDGIEVLVRRAAARP